MFNVIFNRKDKGFASPVGVRFPKPMLDAIDQLCKKTGESRNAMILHMFEEYLTLKAKEGTVPWPKHHTPSKGEKAV